MGRGEDVRGSRGGVRGVKVMGGHTHMHAHTHAHAHTHIHTHTHTHTHTHRLSACIVVKGPHNANMGHK